MRIHIYGIYYREVYFNLDGSFKEKEKTMNREELNKFLGKKLKLHCMVLMLLVF